MYFATKKRSSEDTEPRHLKKTKHENDKAHDVLKNTSSIVDIYNKDSTENFVLQEVVELFLKTLDMIRPYIWKEVTVLNKRWSRLMKTYIETKALFRVPNYNLGQEFLFYQPKRIIYPKNVVPQEKIQTDVSEIHLETDDLHENEVTSPIRFFSSTYPSHLRKIVLKSCGDQKSLHSLPQTLRKIYVGLYKQESIDFLQFLPDLMTSLTISMSYLQTFPQHTPRFLKKLTLDAWFEGDVSNLPSTLEVLRIAFGFNDCVDKLPRGLKKLQLGEHFDHPIDHLPPNLDVLILGISFNQKIDHLPPNLSVLSLISVVNSKYTFDPFMDPDFINPIGCFDQSLDNLPSTLKTLLVPGSKKHNINNLPQSLLFYLQMIPFKWNVKDLPRSLSHLSLGSHLYKDKKKNAVLLNADDLPPKLTHLKIYGLIPNYIPSHVVFLHMGNFNRGKPLCFPASLKRFVCSYKHFYPEVIHKHILELYLYEVSYNKTVFAAVSKEKIKKHCLKCVPSCSFLDGHNVLSIEKEKQNPNTM